MGFRISPKTILNFSIVLFIVSAGFLLLPKPAQAAITFNAETGISGLWRYDNGTGTFTSLGAGATNFDYFTDDCEAGDYLMIASSNINHARNIKLNVGTAFAASSVEFIWEYEETLGVWKPFNNVVDNTNNLSVLGENWVFYDMPERWDAFSKSGIGYYTFLRLRIVSVTAPTEGGRQGATTVKRGNNTLLISGEGTLASPITWDTVYQADLAGGGSANPAGAWGVVTKEGIEHYQATRIGITISSNSYMKSEKEVFEWYGNTVKWWETFSCAGYYRMGIKAGDGSIHSGGRLITAGGYRMTFSGPTYIYDSTIYERIYSDPHIAFSGNPTEFKRVNVESTKFGISGSNWSVDDFYYYNGFGFMISSQPTLFKGYKARAVNWPIYFYMDAAPNIEVKDADVQKILYYRRNVDSYMINHIVPLDNITLTFLGVAGTTYTGRLFDTYTFDLKVIDKDNNPINGASVKITDNQSNEWNLTTDANGKITQQKLHKAHYAYVPGSAGGDNVYVKTDYNPFKIRISSQNYPSREFEFTLDKKTDWVLALKDRPMSVGTVKVWGTEYADDEAGTIYAQVTYGDGTPCNTIASTDITAMVYKSDGSKIIDGANMTYVDGSNGIYKYNFSGSTFSAEGVYIIDVKASSTSPSITAYDSNEIHISKTANRIKTMVADVWGYTGRSLDTIDNIVSGIWGEAQSGYTTSGTFGYYLNSRISTIASDVWSYTSSIGSTLIDNLHDAIWKSTTVRKLTTREIGTGEYISGESTAEKPTEYNIELVRKATFDFAGLADSGSTTTLVDSELDQPDDHWNDYELWMMSGNNIGQKKVICDFDKASNTLTLCSALPYAVSSGDQYVISHERKLVHAIWNWTERQLTSAANIAGDIWGYTGGRTLSSATNIAADIWGATTRKLTGKELTGGGSLATESYIDTATSMIIAEIDANEALLNNLSSDLSDLSATTTLVLNKWGSYTAADIIGYVDEIESRLGTSTDSSSTETIFGRTKFIQEKWGTQTGQTIFDKTEAARALIAEVQTELGYNGTSTTAYADIQLVKGYVDELEGYVGTPSDASSANTLFGKIKDVREKLDQLDTLETKLDTVDSVVDLIRASQQLNYTVELSDVGEVQTTKTYRAKLSIWDYENNPANASTTPTITLYNAVRTEIASSSMTMLSTGVYEYTYTVPSDATCGVWESIVSVDLGGNSALTLNDYWEVEGSPAQVIINRMSDTTVPLISANVTISNEGNSGYEYQYEWCVVTSQDNQCGGGDDVAYASAAKYLAVGEDYTANLSATVSNPGDYWFKVVVYYGTEASGASRTFTATEEEEEVAPIGAGAVAPTASLANIYSKLLEVQNELGYHDTQRTAYKDLANTRYSLGALPDQLSKPLYAVLSGVSSDIQTIGGTKAYSLNDIYEVLEANSTDLSYIVNKSAELRAMAEVNKSLIGQAVNKPIIQTWWTEGSIILNIMAINPPDAARTVTVKEYLPKEIRAEHIIEMEEGLRLEYDSNLDSYFVTTEVKLGAGERKIFKIRIEDVFTIPEEELTALQEQSQTLMEPLKGTSYFAQASILKSEIDANLQSIARTQVEGTANIEKRISIYRNNQKDLQKVKDNIEALKAIVSEASGKAGVFGSLFGVSTTMTWAIIIIVIVGVAVLMILLFTLLARSRALEYHISGGKRLKAPPIVDLKKQAVKIKGGLTTYFLPPFGKPVVDLRQLIKMIKILIIVGVLIILVLLGMRYLLSLFAKQNGGMEGLFSAAVAAPLAPIDLPQIKEALPSPNQIKILETETGWLRVRSSPSFEGEILTVVYFGEEYEYLNEKGGWYEIPLDMAYKSSRGPLETGWIFGEYVENEK